MSKKIEEIKKLVKKECNNSKLAPDWFYETHLLAVEKFSKFLLRKLPKADREIVLLGVWLHDLQRIRDIKGDHEKIGAIEAKKVMKKFSYSKDVIEEVKEIILSHACSKILPKTIEGKILATADAMSHYFNDFYLKIALTGKRNIKDLKRWALEKLNRDYNKKIFFDFAKKKVKKRHEVLKAIFTMK